MKLRMGDRVRIDGKSEEGVVTYERDLATLLVEVSVNGHKRLVNDSRLTLVAPTLDLHVESARAEAERLEHEAAEAKEAAEAAEAAKRQAGVARAEADEDTERKNLTVKPRMDASHPLMRMLRETNGEDET